MRNAGRVLPRKLVEEKLYTWDEEVTSVCRWKCMAIHRDANSVVNIPT